MTYLPTIQARTTLVKTDTVVKTAQVADIASANFSGNTAGLYRASYILETTSGDLTAGAVALTLGWTDGAGVTTATSGNLVLTALGRAQGTVVIQLASGSISYSTTHTGIFGSSTYALYITLERLN